MFHHESELRQLKTRAHMCTCNTFAKLVQGIIYTINPVSHPAEDFGTKGLLFVALHDWSGEGFLTQAAAENRDFQHSSFQRHSPV